MEVVIWGSQVCWLPWIRGCRPFGVTRYGCWELDAGPLQGSICSETLRHLSSLWIFKIKWLLCWTAWLWLFVPSWGIGKVKWLHFTPCPEAAKVQSPGAVREQHSHKQHMASALQDKEDGCVTGASFPCHLPASPPPTLTALSGEGVYIVKPGYCQAQFTMTFIFQ